MKPRSTMPFVAALLAVALSPGAAGAQEGNVFLERGTQSRMKGEQSAPVVVYEIADFQCPFCARFTREIFPQIDSAFVQTGQVQWVFVNLPLPSHANAWAAAESAMCAGAAGDAFWALHDRIFATQAEWIRSADAGAIFTRYARDAGVPADAYDRCVADDRVASLILQDVIFAATSRVSGTPTFIINNVHVVVGMKSFEEWKKLIERELQAPRR